MSSRARPRAILAVTIESQRRRLRLPTEGYWLIVPPAVGVASSLAFAVGLAIPAVQGWVERAERDPLSLLHDHAAVGVQLALVGLVPAAAALVGVFAFLVVGLVVAIVLGGLRGILRRGRR